MKHAFIFLSLISMFQNLNMIASQQTQSQSSWPIIKTCLGGISLYGGLWATLKYGNHVLTHKKPKEPQKTPLPKTGELKLYEDNIAHLQAIIKIAKNTNINNQDRVKQMQEEAEQLNLQEECENFLKVKSIIKSNARDIPTFIKDAFKLNQDQRNTMQRQLNGNDPINKNKLRANYMASKIEQALIIQGRKKQPLEEAWQREVDTQHQQKYANYLENKAQHTRLKKSHAVKAVLGLAAIGAGAWLLINEQK
jgi:hypothetical protein